MFLQTSNMIWTRTFQISATDEDIFSFIPEVAEYKHTRVSVDAWLQEKTGLSPAQLLKRSTATTEFPTCVGMINFLYLFDIFIHENKD